MSILFQLNIHSGVLSQMSSEDILFQKLTVAMTTSSNSKQAKPKSRLTFKRITQGSSFFQLITGYSLMKTSIATDKALFFIRKMLISFLFLNKKHMLCVLIRSASARSF